MVLPPWSNPHWSDGKRDQPWSDFFDLDKLCAHTRVMELDDFLSLRGKGPVIDHVLHYQVNVYREGVRPLDRVFSEVPCIFRQAPASKTGQVNYAQAYDSSWHR